MNAQPLHIIQVILSLALVGLILLQTKGTGLGSTFGGEMSFYQTKRGVEKLLFRLTVIIATLFLVSSVLGILV